MFHLNGSYDHYGGRTPGSASAKPMALSKMVTELPIHGLKQSWSDLELNSQLPG